jgi:uncharacterized membrane protein YdjX (TVP38/TMEM64 family)
LTDPQAISKKRIVLLLAVLALFMALAAAWAWSPLKHWLDVQRIVAALQLWGQTYGPIFGALVVTLALLCAIPLSFLTIVVIVAFGAVHGFFIALTSAVLAAAITFELGKLLGHDVLIRLGGERVNAISHRLGKNGLLAVIAIRLVPIAPFAIVNMVVGTSHIRRRDMLLGTALGMTPGTLIMVFFIDQILAALTRPSATTGVLVALALVLILIGGIALRRWSRKITTHE